MSKTNRRKFLHTAAGATALAPLGCTAPETPSEDVATAPAPPVAESAPAVQVDTEMSIAKWSGTADPAGDLTAISTQVTEAAINGMGGMARFVKRGDTVWVKPNIAIHAVEQFAANSNPAVVATLCRLAFEAGAAKVLVGDTSAYGAEKAYPMSGIEAAVHAAGGEMVYLKDADYRNYDLGGDFLKQWKLAPAMIDADLLINVPILKHHALTNVTIGMKNLMGLAHGTKQTWHDNIDTALADITAFYTPRLNVMDAIRALVRHGPKGGDMKDVDFKGLVAASTDIVALDAAGAELIGFQPNRVRTIMAGAQRGLGQIDFRSLKLKQTRVG